MNVPDIEILGLVERLAREAGKSTTPPPAAAPKPVVVSDLPPPVKQAVLYLLSLTDFVSDQDAYPNSGVYSTSTYKNEPVVVTYKDLRDLAKWWKENQ